MWPIVLVLGGAALLGGLDPRYGARAPAPALGVFPRESSRDDGSSTTSSWLSSPCAGLPMDGGRILRSPPRLPTCPTFAPRNSPCGSRGRSPPARRCMPLFSRWKYPPHPPLWPHLLCRRNEYRMVKQAGSLSGGAPSAISQPASLLPTWVTGLFYRSVMRYS